ncbi:hypothetical protein GOP47_0010457 [Adiantum capillus-veneris]|uniref:Protein kinase domain-containing protein n=1 Tax=Adiantum capillus-veneris TaxID=13818 RepID=A0A9D4UV16_ADICA|nr:hypothetical protein GOP47_0010457 [Adiantum capillus-veneris]
MVTNLNKVDDVQEDLVEPYGSTFLGGPEEEVLEAATCMEEKMKLMQVEKPLIEEQVLPIVPSEEAQAMAMENLIKEVKSSWIATVALMEHDPRVSLQELSSSIQDVASSPSNFVLHRTQCCCLARSYALTIDHVTQQLHWNRSVVLDLQPCLSELHHAMLQGRKFLQDCSFQDGWVRKALILAFTSEAQDVFPHDLEEDCLQLINALKHDIADWEHQLSQKDLPTNLQEEVMAQCCLARYLLQKLENESIVGESNDSLLECLWVDPLQFTIKQSIGHGAFATVHEVEWFGQRFAQKEFFDVDESFFGKEAAIQGRLRHPNVLQLICCTSNRSVKKCSLVTELMDMDLKCAIDKRCTVDCRPFPPLIAVDLMLQIAKGMEYLHGLHVMHRDLKSKNLLVCDQVGAVKRCWFPLRKFPYKELHQATDGFDINNRIKTNISLQIDVFKGRLVDGQMVAVKLFREYYFAWNGFMTELGVSSRVRHRNLVPLLGFCLKEGSFVLVYKLMPGGSLLNYLRPDGVTQLTWAQKYKIVCGVASALSYLQYDWSPPVLHRDVKPSNILLDDNQEACLTDFGDAIPLSDGEIDIVGTPVYIAPEYVQSGKLGLEADVYSFGVVVLELLCGRRALDVVEYAWRLHAQERLLDATRENIGREGHHCNEEELRRLLHLGLTCTSDATQKIVLPCSELFRSCQRKRRHQFHCIYLIM